MKQILNDGNGIFVHQPYIFAVKTSKENITQLLEVQSYTKRVVLISTWNKTSQILTFKNENAYERRSNLTGAILRVACPTTESYELMTELLNLCQRKFNFSIKRGDSTDLEGQFENGCSWKGIIRELIEDKLDFGMK